MAQRTSKYPPKTLVNLTEVKVYAATFVDGGSVSDTRLVAKIGEHLHFLHPEGVDSKIKQPAGWLKEAISSKISQRNGNSDQASVPEDKVSDLPVGGIA